MRRAAGAPRAGFSLIEALVALAIAAMVLAAIFELQVQMSRSQVRAAETLEQVAAQENAIVLLRDLNPTAQPEGVIALPGGDTVRWTSSPQGEAMTNAGFPAGNGRFEVRRYTITATIERPDARSPRPLVFDRLGWRRLDRPTTD